MVGSSSWDDGVAIAAGAAEVVLPVGTDGSQSTQNGAGRRVVMARERDCSRTQVPSRHTKDD